MMTAVSNLFNIIFSFFSSLFSSLLGIGGATTVVSAGMVPAFAGIVNDRPMIKPRTNKVRRGPAKRSTARDAVKYMKRIRREHGQNVRTGR